MVKEVHILTKHKTDNQEIAWGGVSEILSFQGEMK